ncbi:MAG: HDOD domain-containing protein [Pseudomonadota bacterium]
MPQETKFVDKAILRKLYPLTNLLADDLDDLAKKTQVENLPAGSLLYTQGATDPHTIYLIAGSVELRDRDEQTSKIDADSATARRPLSPQKPRNATATALTDIAIIRIEDKLLELMINTSNLAQPVKPQTLDPNVIEERLFGRLYQDYLEDNMLLPSMPDIALRVRNAIDDQSRGVEDIAKIVQADPALTARLVQVANSPLYRGQGQINSCRNAITRLGLKQTRNLVYSFAMKQLFRSTLPALRQRMIQLWQHTTSVAAISAVLAQRTPGFEVDRGLLAGLIHDIGVLPIMAYAERYPQLVNDAEVFDNIVARLRGQIGALVLRRWEFDDELINVALEAEAWNRTGDPDKADYVDLVIMAQLHSYIGTSRMSKLPAIDQVPAFKKLALGKLSPRMSVQILEDSREDIAEVEKLLLG